MTRRAVQTVTILALVLSAMPGQAVIGVPDVVPAASLVFPLLETGVNITTHPHDTLVVVYASSGPVMIHWQIWDVDGTPAPSLQGSRSMAVAETWSAATRDLIGNLASTADKALLTDGAYYRGFMTVDVVTAATTATPLDASYPFRNVNSLLGYGYFTRLSEGSANGLPALHLEVAASPANSYLRDFYCNSDDREEIDTDALACSDDLAKGNACTGDADDVFERVRGRVFYNAALNGTSRLVVFNWPTCVGAGSGGVSIYCDTHACDSSYPYARRLENGDFTTTGTIRLNHVVSIFEMADGGVVDSGEVLLSDIHGSNVQLTAFTFNKAAPSSGALNWDAIFPAAVSHSQ